ncbi:Actin filament-associated protein 1-like 1, partial [Ameca splendens]
SGPDYIYVNSSVYKNGTSFVESLFEKFDCELGDLKEVTDYLKDDKKTQDDTLKQSCTDSPPPLPTTPPPEDYYEEAVPLSPGMATEYIITRDRPSPPNSIDDVYEDTDNHYLATSINSHRKNSYNDSDALSSSYESYEEDEEERSPGVTHQWPSDESNIPPVRDCRICAFLLRKKRFGQWAKQFTVIRENRLQCYKNSKDTCPYVDLLLPQCSVVYVPKDSKKKHHELRFTLPNGDGLVLAVQSREQAHKWLKVVRKVSSQSGPPDEAASPNTQRKNELDKYSSKPPLMTRDFTYTTREGMRAYLRNRTVAKEIGAFDLMDGEILHSECKEPQTCPPGPETDMEETQTSKGPPEHGNPRRTTVGTTAIPPEKSRGEPQAATAQKPQGAATTNPQAPLAAVYAGPDPAMD